MKAPRGGEVGTRYGPFVVTGVLSYGRGARVALLCDCGRTHAATLHSLKTSVRKGLSIFGCKSCQAREKSRIGMERFDFSRYKGRRFGRLVVTGVDIDAGRRDDKSRLVCLCDCGAQAVVRAVHLYTGKTTSCGCFHRERQAQNGRETGLIHANTSDGELNGHTSLYRAWMKVKACCKAGKEKGVGKVCHEYDSRWDDFRAFYADFGPIGRYQTISRIDQQQPWSKENCCVSAGRRHLFEDSGVSALAPRGGAR